MKKTIIIILVLVFSIGALVSACSTSQEPAAKIYSSYGPLNAGKYQSKNVCYETSGWSIFLGIVLFETIVAPIYFFGYSLYNPVRMKRDPADQCTADG